MRCAVIILVLCTSVFQACGREKGKEYIHSAFTVTMEDLDTLLANEKQPVREAIKNDPAGFLGLMATLVVQPEILLRLVDKQHALSADYAPLDLVRLVDYGITVRKGREYLSMRAITIPDILEMVKAARAEDIDLEFSSTYRSWADQDRIYKYNVDKYGQEQADRESAQPGKSQHQLGTTADFGSITDDFADTPAGIWLYNNAWRYGFSLSYPDGYEKDTGYRHEIWHYRYTGKTGTLMERRFFGGIQQYFLEFIDRHRAFFADRLVHKD
ncbi:MAG: M15 family metallopeptidase [Spirochaetales bacterium]|nr:M15 family metallopeptidase [Spirochaetales bacterium]